MSSRGTTLIELVIGVVAASILALATAALVKAGVSTYTYCMRQNRMLEAARKSMVYGDAGRKGIVWGSQIGSVVNGVQGSSVTVVSNSGALYSTYYVSNNVLKIQSGSATNSLATYISTVSYAYYNITDTGLIMPSTAANMANLVTVQMTMQGAASQKTYYFYSGAKLRNSNHP